VTSALALVWRHASGQAELEREVRLELDSHVAALRDEYRGAGHDDAEAARLARERFGDLDAHVEACVKERWNKERPMRTLLSIMSVLLVAALLVTLSHGHTLQAREEAARAEQYALMHQLASLKQAEAARTPTPVVFNIGDTLHVFDALHSDTIDARVRIVADGKILLPELGWVTAHGMERSALEADLTERYLKYFEDSKIFVAPVDAVLEK
jgi:hypothetical protein